VSERVVGRTPNASTRWDRALAGAALGVLMPGGSVAQGAGVKRVGELNPFLPDDPTQLANAKGLRPSLAAFRLDARAQSRLDQEDRSAQQPRLGNGGSRIRRGARRRVVVFDAARLEAAAQATKTIPIVALSGAIPVNGFAQSLARPGGNVTGVVFQERDENGRVVALLREIRPGLQRIGIPKPPANTTGGAWRQFCRRGCAGGHRDCCVAAAHGFGGSWADARRGGAPAGAGAGDADPAVPERSHLAADHRLGGH
jgi:hypothetical protein